MTQTQGLCSVLINMAFHPLKSQTWQEGAAPLQQEQRWLPPTPLQELVKEQKPWPSAPYGFIYLVTGDVNKKEIFLPIQIFCILKGFDKLPGREERRAQRNCVQTIFIMSIRASAHCKSHHLLLRATYCFVVWILFQTQTFGYL